MMGYDPAMRDVRVWVIGASSGIGAATALQFIREGARVVVSARRSERLESLRAESGHPERVTVLPFDLIDDAARQDAYRRVVETLGGVDVVVHSAGVSQRALAKDTALEVDRRIMELNYFAVIALTKTILPDMLSRRSGHFVVVSSVSGHVGSRGRSAYSASKHALHGFFEALRAETADAGISVTMVCPGYVRTEISASALRGDGTAFGADEAKTDSHVEKGLSPDKVAQAIVNGVRRRSPDVIIGGTEVAAIYLKRFAPRLLRTLVRRQRASGADS